MPCSLYLKKDCSATVECEINVKTDCVAKGLFTFSIYIERRSARVFVIGGAAVFLKPSELAATQPNLRGELSDGDSHSELLGTLSEGRFSQFFVEPSGAATDSQFQVSTTSTSSTPDRPFETERPGLLRVELLYRKDCAGAIHRISPQWRAENCHLKRNSLW